MISPYVEKALASLDGYAQAEAYASDSFIHTIYIDGTRISNIETKREAGIMVRIADGGRQGKASTVLNGDSSVSECVRMAESVLRYSPVGEERSFAQPAQARHALPDVWDRRAEQITSEELRELAGRLIDSCDVDIPRAQIRVSSNEFHVMNSNGVDAIHRSTLVYGHFISMYRGEHPGEGAEKYHGTGMDLPIEEIGRTLSRQARDAASAHAFQGHKNLSVILPPGELSEMMLSSIGSAINGENVKYGRSLWKDSIGSEVASSYLTVVDDPTVSAPLSCVFDDEGTPTERRPVIENGRLSTFLRDSFCGPSTGNGMRRSSEEAMGSFERTPVVKPLNMSVKPGRLDRDGIIRETDRGILVERFANPEADELSGGFGLNVRCGYMIEHGEVVGIINNALLMGNMLDAVKAIDHIGGDAVQTGVMTLPTMSFSGAELVGN